MMNNLLQKIGVSREDLPLFLLFTAFPACFALLAFAALLRGEWFALVLIIFGIPFATALSFGVFNQYRKGMKKTEIEKGRNLIYSQRGSRSQTQVTVYDGLLAVTVTEVDKIFLFPQDIANLTPHRSPLVCILTVITFKPHQTYFPIMIQTGDPENLKNNIEYALRLKEMPQYGKEPMIEGLPEHEKRERKKYPWLQ